MVAHQPTFDVESKNPKIQNSHFSGGGGGSLTGQLLMLSPKILNSKIPISGGEGEGGWSPANSNLKFSKSNPELKFLFPGGRGGRCHHWNVWNLVLPPSVQLG